MKTKSTSLVHQAYGESPIMKDFCEALQDYTLSNMRTIGIDSFDIVCHRSAGSLERRREKSRRKIRGRIV